MYCWLGMVRWGHREWWPPERTRVGDQVGHHKKNNTQRDYSGSEGGNETESSGGSRLFEPLGLRFGTAMAQRNRFWPDLAEVVAHQGVSAGSSGTGSPRSAK